MKKSFLVISVLFSLIFASFAERGKVTILYTNDIHTYITNTVKNAAGEKVPGLSYGSIAAMKKDIAASGEQVALFDAGDHVQGTAYGAMDNGASIIKFMNAAGYDIATLGNHEFDYGAARVFEVFKEASFPYVSANFFKAGTKKTVLPAYKILTFGNTKIAVIGITTPETYTKSTPVYFMDKKQKKFIYSIAAGDDGAELYAAVQAAIDEASKKADYVIALGHLGVDPSSAPWRSTDVIANTQGLDAFIDGHSHNTVEHQLVQDKAGKNVVLTQTGCYLASIGKMVLNDTEISTELVTSYENTNVAVDALVKNWVKNVDEKLNEKIAVLDKGLYVNEPENPKARLVRSQETNLGDFTADAVYYHFNEVEKLNCDVAVGNGGGIRADLPAGDYSYNSAKKVQPFGNVICLVQLTGKELLDALEWGARDVGVGECGGFLHVAGLKFTIDTSVKSTVSKDGKGLWTAGPSGEYRVKDVAVYNRATGEYEPLDMNKAYTLGGINYTLRNMGDGFKMLASTKLVKDYVGEDYLITSAYAKAFAADESGMPHINTQSSPLNGYKNYLLDYENPNGSGRITIK